MTTDSGKKPFKFTLIKRTPEEPTIVLLSDFTDRSIPWNELIEVQEVTPCANCERLEGESDKYRRTAESTYKFQMNQSEEIQRLQKQLEMCKVAIKDFLDCSGNIEQNDERLRWLKQAVEKL